MTALNVRHAATALAAFLICLAVAGTAGAAKDTVLYTSVIPNTSSVPAVKMVYECRALNVGAVAEDITVQMFDASGGNWTTPRLCAATQPGINCVDFVEIDPPTVANVFCKIDTPAKAQQIRASLIAREVNSDIIRAISDAR